MATPSPLEAVAAKLDKLKMACTDACADEAVHAAHRGDMEAAYAELARLSREAVGPAHVAAANHTLKQS